MNYKLFASIALCMGVAAFVGAMVSPVSAADDAYLTKIKQVIESRLATLENGQKNQTAKYQAALLSLLEAQSTEQDEQIEPVTKQTPTPTASELKIKTQTIDKATKIAQQLQTVQSTRLKNYKSSLQKIEQKLAESNGEQNPLKVAAREQVRAAYEAIANLTAKQYISTSFIGTDTKAIKTNLGQAKEQMEADMKSLHATIRDAQSKTNELVREVQAEKRGVRRPDEPTTNVKTSESKPPSFPRGERPVVQTLTLTSSGVYITPSTIRMGAQVNPNGSPTNYWFEWGVGRFPTTLPNKTKHVSAGSGTSYSIFYSLLTGLTPNTYYTYKAYASNQYGTSSGIAVAYLTEPLPLPTVTTKPATNITHSSSTLNGTVNPKGTDANFWFEYGLTQSNLTSSTPQYPGSGNIVINHQRSISTTPNTTYYFRLKAQNTAGTSVGSILNFTTLPLAAPSNLIIALRYSNRIDIFWTDNSNNETGFKIERKIGSTGTYSQIATVGSNQQFFSNFTTLPDTQYFYRVRAYNNDGNSLYSNEAIVTTAPKPTVSILPATNITTSSATLNGSVNPNGTSTSYWFEWWQSAGGQHATSSLQSAGSGTNTINVSTDISQLINTTSYYNLLWARNSNGIESSSTISTFTTQ